DFHVTGFQTCALPIFPVTSTLMGLGGYPADRQFLGMLGMHGFYEANMAMDEADVVLAIGARFDDRVTNTPSRFCPGAKIIHIDRSEDRRVAREKRMLR